MTVRSAPTQQRGNPLSNLTVVQKRVFGLTIIGALFAVLLVTFPGLF
jgi:hypothetical protein